MPVKPQAVQIKCRQCGCKTIYAPSSDALLIANPEICNRCGSAELDCQPASVVDAIQASISTLMSRK